MMVQHAALAHSELSSKIVLGTVQLGLPYGRLHNSSLMPRDAAFAILDAAWDTGVRCFDTAEAYGESASRLAEWLGIRNRAGHAHVITKIQVNDISHLSQDVRRATGRFENCASVTLLTHGPCAGELWESVAATCREVDVAAGQSIYAPDELSAALALRGVERIQAPGNVLDMRAFHARGSATVPLDIRSVYLQGVLLETPENAERRVPGAEAIVKALRSASQEINCPLAELLIAVAMNSSRDADRLVLGVDKAAQVAVMTNAFEISSARVNAFRAQLEGCLPATLDLRLLDPRLW